MSNKIPVDGSGPTVLAAQSDLSGVILLKIYSNGRPGKP